MAIPLALGFYTVEGLVTIDVARVGIATITNQQCISNLSMIALIAEPVHKLVSSGLKFELFGLHSNLLSLMSEEFHFSSTIGAFSCILQPLFQTF